MVFNQAYSDLLAKLPASLINEAWIRLISQKCKPLSEKEASEINPIVKSFLKHEASSSETRAPELAFEYKLLPFAFVMIISFLSLLIFLIMVNPTKDKYLQAFQAVLAIAKLKY
ncbi:hypothetical protein RhiirB3_432334 [Rhizophagus irregularis]|nr:hypothetical protein RhiirB3_432334 [Rhizophagus irregularis]